MTAVRALLDKLRTAGVTERADVALARGGVPFVASQRVLTESVQRIAEMLADAMQADACNEAADIDEGIVIPPSVAPLPEGSIDAAVTPVRGVL